MLKDEYSYNLLYKLNIIQIKILTNYIIMLDELILKFMWGNKHERLTKKLQKKKEL